MNRHERRERRAKQRKTFPHIGIGALVVYVDRAGDGSTYELKVVAICPRCACPAVVPLPPPLLEKQTDETTHVCLPQIGGCNVGLTYEPAPEVAETKGAKTET